jgi:pimeloyl-ACP methyl ester carboxylesterase
MPTVPVADRVLAYGESGSGEPIVWLQGTGESKQGFIAQTSELSERYRCIATDHRDVGESTYVDEPYTPADLAADAAAVMDALGIGAAHIVGYSLGGATAQELALARPDLVRSLVLLSTWPASDEWFKAQMRNWQSIRRQHWDDEEGFLDALGAWLWSPATYATPGLVEGLNTFMLNEEPRQRPEGWIRQCDADIAHDAAARLGAITVPTLVIVGEDDLCTPPRYARELCSLLPSAELVTISDAAHGALGEKPGDVNAAIGSFVAKH